MANVIGGMHPNPSSRGRHKHSPCLRAVEQAKQGKHQNEKQPIKKNQYQMLGGIQCRRNSSAVAFYQMLWLCTMNFVTATVTTILLKKQ